jgi:hypothetical protein
MARQLRGALGAARRELLREGISAPRRLATLAAVAVHHEIRLTGAFLGSRADRLPAGARRRLSLEGRAGFSPLDLDRSPARQSPTEDPVQ